MDTPPSGLEKQLKVTGKEPAKGGVSEYKATTTNADDRAAKTQQNTAEKYFLHWLKDF